MSFDRYVPQGQDDLPSLDQHKEHGGGAITQPLQDAVNRVLCSLLQVAQLGFRSVLSTGMNCLQCALLIPELLRILF
jgi:hypothetical protein